MKTKVFLTTALFLIVTATTFAQNSEKLVSSKTHIRFFSSTPAEDIEANNYTSTGALTKTTGEVVFSVPMQGFEFEKRLMQKHFNNKDFLDTQEFPRARFVGKISNLAAVDFSKDGTYKTGVEGEMTIKGKTNPIKENGTITVKGNTAQVKSVFDITLADYGITFVKGKPSTNIAKTVEVTLVSDYTEE